MERFTWLNHRWGERGRGQYYLDKRDHFFRTYWTPLHFQRYTFEHLAVNLEKMIQENPERAKAINWDEGCLNVGGRILTLRQILDRAISGSDNGYWQTFFMDLTYHQNKYGIFGEIGQDDDMDVYMDKFKAKRYDRIPGFIKVKQILLQQGAKPKTTSLTLQRKKKLTIPEDAPYVDWAKWGATIQDPRVKGGATRKRSKKSRKNMSRKRRY